MSISNTARYASLCYHYIRKPKNCDPFPKILGPQLRSFIEHVKMSQNYYQIISADDALNFSYGNLSFKNKSGLLFTFDDGLSDHYRAAEILADKGIKGIFFIPTCILSDLKPANPTIYHYCLAAYKVKDFLKYFCDALDHFSLNINDLNIDFAGNDIWQARLVIRDIFRYKLAYGISRKILLHIYENALLKDYPDIMQIMHLTKNEIEEIIKMGHTIGAHSYSHPSIASSKLSKEQFRNEVVEPKQYLEQVFQTKINSFSYPFGTKRDCFDYETLLSKTKAYKLAFTIDFMSNAKETNPLELGRYTPMQTDTARGLKQIINSIVDGKKL